MLLWVNCVCNQIVGRIELMLFSRYIAKYGHPGACFPEKNSEPRSETLF